MKLELFFKNKKAVLLVLASAILIVGIVILWNFLKKEKAVIFPQGQESKSIEEILRDLTPASSTPLTEKEKKDLEKTLKNLTPQKPKPLTAKQKEIVEELLKSLTPK